MKIKSFELGPVATNCYIVSKNKKCLIVDPGAQPDVIIAYIDENKLIPEAILLTHAHFDHIGAVDAIRKQYDIEVYMHETEVDWLTSAENNRSLLYFGPEGAIESGEPEHLLTPGRWHVGSFSFEVRHTPGHSPGSVSFVFHDDEFIISGDVLFQQSIGRTDLPMGNFEQLMQSIFEKIYTLPDQFVVYPGHGPATSIAREKQTNPFTTQYEQQR